ncbi:MAG: response regulator transcription factor [Colwellia sp.]
MNIRVLLVEDNVDLAKTVIQFLTLEGFETDYVGNGHAGFNLAIKNKYDVFILDINLPGLDGLSLCQKLRLQGIDAPILMLTARDTLTDKLAGFEAGTDDYLIKPFSLDELLARIKVLAKRKSGQSLKLQVTDLYMDLDRKTVTRANNELILTPICWTILEVLLRKSPNVVHRSDLVQAIWGDEPPESNNLKVQMHKLRKMVDGDSKVPLIETVRGYGFVIREHNESSKEYS